MNVHMVEHQRSILAVLGVDVWTPKVNTSVRNYSSALYRDQAAPDTDLQHSPVEFETLELTQVDHKVPIQSNTQTEVSVVRVSSPSIETTVDQQLESELSTRNPIHLEAFELQAWCTEHCVIVVNTTQLNTAEAKLWRNIQMAQTGQYFDLKWPFALAPLQDGRGVQAYIQGFLDAMRGEKMLLSLGQMKHCSVPDLLVMPTLSEMLEQPQLKRQLWQHMRGSH